MTSTEKYILLTGNNCVWCDKAKAVLTLRDKVFSEFNIGHIYSYWDGEYDLDEVRPYRRIFDALGFKTVPQVFHVSTEGTVKHIGGFTDLQAHFNNAG